MNTFHDHRAPHVTAQRPRRHFAVASYSSEGTTGRRVTLLGLSGWLLAGLALVVVVLFTSVGPAQAATTPGSAPAQSTGPGATTPDAASVRPARPETNPAPATPAGPGAASTSVPASTPPPATPTGSATGSNTGDSGALSPLDAKDTHGLSISKYQLSVDTGGVTSPMKTITNGVLLSGAWVAYQWTVGAGVSLINLTLQMTWVDWVVDAITPVATTLKTDVVDRLHLTTLSMMIMAVTVAIMWAAGRYARGFTQLLISTTLAALAAGALANPVAVFTSDNGLLYSARDAGQAVATVITSNGKSNTPDPELIQEKTGAALVDTFVRLPHQMINYGQVLDSQACQQAYDDALADGPYDSDDDAARSAVGDCDEKLKDWADDPGWSGVISILVLAPAGAALVVLAVVLAVIVFLATLSVVFYGLKLIIDLVLAIAGTERSGLWTTAAGVLGALIMTAASIVMLALYCIFLRGVLSAPSGDGLLVRFLMTDIMVIAFIVMTVMARKRIAERARKLADKTAAFTGGGKSQPTQMPKLSQARQAISQAAATRAAGGRMLGGPGGSAGGAGVAAGASTASAGSAAQRVMRRVANNRVVKTGLTAASLAGGAAGLAAKATIGAPVYGPRAARVVKAAARTRAAAARTAIKTKVGQGRAFAGEYRDGLAIVGRPAAKVGKAAGRKAAPAVVAASIGLSTPRGSNAGTAATGISTTRSGTPAGASPRRNAMAARQRQATRREAQRAAVPPRSSTGTSAQPGVSSRTYRVTQTAPTPPATTGTRDDAGAIARLYARRQLRQAARERPQR